MKVRKGKETNSTGSIDECVSAGSNGTGNDSHGRRYVTGRLHILTDESFVKWNADVLQASLGSDLHS